MKFKEESIKFGTVTILVNIGGLAPLVLTGTILAEIPRYHDDPPSIVFPKKIEVDGKVKVEGDITVEEDFLILRVTGATLPEGFPLTIAELTTDIAISIDSIILVLPVTVI